MNNSELSEQRLDEEQKVSAGEGSKSGSKLEKPKDEKEKLSSSAPDMSRLSSTAPVMTVSFDDDQTTSARDRSWSQAGYEDPPPSYIRATSQPYNP